MDTRQKQQIVHDAVQAIMLLSQPKNVEMPTPREWGLWIKGVSKIIHQALNAYTEEGSKPMETEEEPIVAMARFIYNVASRKGPEYDQLPLSTQFHWQSLAAQAWEIYWTARERRENR